jgi:excisionase family DNA binding protein
MFHSPLAKELYANPRTMKVCDVALRLVLDTDTVCKYAAAGIIPAVKVGTRWRIESRMLAVWLENEYRVHVMKCYDRIAKRIAGEQANT